MPDVSNYQDFQSFVTRLNDATSLFFYIPSINEWQFAAKGGLLSLGYTYAGSNTPGDVAWYSGNAKGVSHPVKQLAPNELGLYDMSGNLSEWTSTRNTTYSDYYYYICGGNYSEDETRVEWSYCSFARSSNNAAGLRLALKCK